MWTPAGECTDIDEYVVFCAPTKLQREVYKTLLGSQGLQNCLYNGDTQLHLKAITLMRKLCNAVSLTTTKLQTVSSPASISNVSRLLTILFTPVSQK